MARALPIKEKDLQKAAIEIMHRFGWLVAHFHTVQSSRGVWQTPVSADGKGFPDAVAVRERIVFVEFKVGRNTLRAEQIVWRDAIIKAGGEWWLIDEHLYKSGLEKIFQ